MKPRPRADAIVGLIASVFQYTKRSQEDIIEHTVGENEDSCNRRPKAENTNANDFARW